MEAVAGADPAIKLHTRSISQGPIESNPHIVEQEVMVKEHILPFERLLLPVLDFQWVGSRSFGDEVYSSRSEKIEGR
jgi:hypothetical protein